MIIFLIDLLVLKLIHLGYEIVSSECISNSLVGSLLLLFEFHNSSLHEDFLVLGQLVLINGFHHVILGEMTGWAKSSSNAIPVGVTLVEIRLGSSRFECLWACLLMTCRSPLTSLLITKSAFISCVFHFDRLITQIIIKVLFYFKN